MATKTQAETSWITKNVLENKIFNALIVALIVSVPVTCGFVDDWSTNGLSAILTDYSTIFQTSKAVAISTVDLFTLTVVAATVIPKDYALRAATNPINDEDDITARGKKIAAATTLLPVLGAALYCVWRPALPKE